MIHKVNEQVRKNNPEMKYAIYMGHEIKANLCGDKRIPTDVSS